MLVAQGWQVVGPEPLIDQMQLASANCAPSDGSSLEEKKGLSVIAEFRGSVSDTFFFDDVGFDISRMCRLASLIAFQPDLVGNLVLFPVHILNLIDCRRLSLYHTVGTRSGQTSRQR